MAIVYTELFKIVFGILLILILCMLNFNVYYLSETNYKPHNPFLTPRLVVDSREGSLSLQDYSSSSPLRTEGGNGYQSEQLVPTMANTVTSWRYTLHKLSNDVATKELEERSEDVDVYQYSDNSYEVPSTQTTLQSQDKNVSSTHTFTYPPRRLASHIDTRSKRGYVMAIQIYEQQTMASGNLLQLQCWANYFNLVVVKPLMHDSSLLTPLDENVHQKMIKLDDIFDMSDWDQHASDKSYAPLVEWNDFVQNAPRNLILVQMKYPILTYVKSVRAKGLPFPHPPDGSEKYKQGCKFRMIRKKGAEFLTKHRFKVVRKVCFNFVTGVELPMKQFHKDIFGDYDVTNVTIIIDEWRGLGENQRVLVQENICKEEEPYREHTKPSLRIITDAQLYTNTYIKEIAQNYNYLAVIARFEMTGLTRRITSQKDAHAIIPYCLQQTLQHVERLKQKTSLTNVFLSFDAGKYGSHSFAQKRYYGHLEDLESFVGKVYDGDMNINEWEKTFEKVARFRDSGYIAMLQQIIVTRAKCILFVGGGSFQRHALHLYQELHPDPKDRCIEVIEKCTSTYRPIDYAEK